MIRDEVDILYTLSDAELVLYWQRFGEFPTTSPRQRARLARLVKTDGRDAAERLSPGDQKPAEEAAA
jgi:hypothetical protein